jgi:hypothetical protein
MPLKLNKPLPKTFKLEDGEDKFSITVVPATQGAVDRWNSENFAGDREYTNSGTLKISNARSPVESERLAVYLTLGFADIYDGDKLLWNFSDNRIIDSYEKFVEGWGLLYPSVANAIVKAVYEVNPQFDPLAKKK